MLTADKLTATIDALLRESGEKPSDAYAAALFAEHERQAAKPTIPFQYAAMSEMARLVERCALSPSESAKDIAAAWNEVGGGYFSLGHYPWAAKYYEKALAAFERSDDKLADDEELSERLEQCLYDLAVICGVLGDEQRAAMLLATAGRILPACVEGIKKRLGKRERIKRDPFEATARYFEILPELDTKIEAELADAPRGMGFCFKYWKAKGEILRRDYNVEWHSPNVLNPHIRFD